MERICKKCGAIHRSATGDATEACPGCGAIYSKVEATERIIARQMERRKSAVNAAPNPAPPTTPAIPPAASHVAQALEKQLSGGRKVFNTVLGIFLLFALIIWLSDEISPTNSADSPTASRSVIDISPAVLYAGYQSNEVRQDARLSGSDVRVTSTVTEISLDFTDDVILRLAIPGQSYESIAVSMVDSARAQAMDISKGDTVTVTCKRFSLIMGSPYGSDCRF